MKRLLLADDHQLFLDGLASILSGLPDVEVAGKVLNGKQVLEWLHANHADLVLMDVNMPLMDGVEATQQIKAQFPGTLVLILTMHDAPDFIARLVQAGADGYILKNTGQEELHRAILQVASGRQYYSGAVTASMMNSLRKPEKPASETANLTRREVDVLRLIAQECTTQEIADKLFISTHTVETHRKNLLSKLGAKNTAGLVRYAIKLEDA